MFNIVAGTENQALASSEFEVADQFLLPHAPCLDSLPGTVLAWALAYAKAEWPVFPCQANRKPLTPHGFKDATIDPQTIKAWWAKWSHAEIGWAIPEGILAVDLDEKDGYHGIRDFFELTGVEADDYPAPSTISPSGGRHLFFSTNGKTYGNCAKFDGLGIDIRAAGKGYVVLPNPANGRSWVRTFGDCQPPPVLDWVPEGKAWVATESTGPSPFYGETTAASVFLVGVCEAVATAPNGKQEWTLNRQCFRAGGVVADGGLQYQVAYDALLAAALRMVSYRRNEPWVQRDLRPKVAAALNDGGKSPWLPREVGWEIDELQNEWASDKNQERLFRDWCEAMPELLRLSGLGSPANENQGLEPSEPEPEPQKAEPPKPKAEKPKPKPEAKPVDPRAAPGGGGANRTNHPAGPSGGGAKGADIVCAADIVVRPKDWLWRGHLLRGAQELLTGIPGLGKSQVQIHFVACATAGLAWPDGASAKALADVVMLTAEDTLDQEVVPRLIAAGANLKRVHILKAIRTDERTRRQFLLNEDLAELEKHVSRIGNVGLITIDPITAFMGSKIDSHKTTEVRAQLGPLKDFAERMNVAVSTITHPPKSAGQKAIDQFIGSQAFIAAGRIGHVCVAEMDEDDKPTGRILFANAKNNPHILMPTLAYRISETVVGQDADTRDNIAAPHVVWDAQPVEINADQAIAASNGAAKPPPRGAQERVQAFVKEMLKDGPVAAQKTIEEAQRRSITASQLQTARAALGVEADKGRRGPWMCRWPDAPF